jgi:hypothetical protein
VVEVVVLDLVSLLVQVQTEVLEAEVLETELLQVVLEILHQLVHHKETMAEVDRQVQMEPLEVAEVLMLLEAMVLVTQEELEEQVNQIQLQEQQLPMQVEAVVELMPAPQVQVVQVAVVLEEKVLDHQVVLPLQEQLTLAVVQVEETLVQQVDQELLL